MGILPPASFLLGLWQKHLALLTVLCISSLFVVVFTQFCSREWILISRVQAQVANEPFELSSHWSLFKLNDAGCSCWCCCNQCRRAGDMVGMGGGKGGMGSAQKPSGLEYFSMTSTNSPFCRVAAFHWRRKVKSEGLRVGPLPLQNEFCFPLDLEYVYKEIWEYCWGCLVTAFYVFLPEMSYVYVNRWRPWIPMSQPECSLHSGTWALLVMSGVQIWQRELPASNAITSSWGCGDSHLSLCRPVFHSAILHCIWILSH